jgi:hypothetical protein
VDGRFLGLFSTEDTRQLDVRVYVFVYSTVSTSVAEPHHFYAAPAPGKNFYAAPVPAPTLLYSKV